MEAGDGAGSAATTAPTRFIFSFFQNAIMDYGLWINRFKNVKNGLRIVYK
jgi:hypothetical protein